MVTANRVVFWDRAVHAMKPHIADVPLTRQRESIPADEIVGKANCSLCWGRGMVKMDGSLVICGCATRRKREGEVKTKKQEAGSSGADVSEQENAYETEKGVQVGAYD